MKRVVAALALAASLAAFGQTPAAKPPTAAPLSDHDQNIILKAAMKAQTATSAAQQAQQELQRAVSEVKDRNKCADLQQDAAGNLTCTLKAPEKK